MCAPRKRVSLALREARGRERELGRGGEGPARGPSWGRSLERRRGGAGLRGCAASAAPLPPSLSLSLFVSALSLPASPCSLRAGTHSCFRARGWVPPEPQSPAPAPSGQGGRSVHGGSGVGPQTSFSASSYFFPSPNSGSQTLPSLPHSASCCKLAVNLRPSERHSWVEGMGGGHRSHSKWVPVVPELTGGHL